MRLHELKVRRTVTVPLRNVGPEDRPLVAALLARKAGACEDLRQVLAAAPALAGREALAFLASCQRKLELQVVPALARAETQRP